MKRFVVVDSIILDRAQLLPVPEPAMFMGGASLPTLVFPVIIEPKFKTLPDSKI